MPYVTEERKDELSTGMIPVTPGDLNYILTCLAIQYVQDNGLTYQTINDVVGALEGCKLEFYRRMAAPYEDTKIQENGDVYPEA